MNPPGAEALDALNDQIAAFVSEPATLRLKPGTGYYSALFRGSLFGLTRTAEVAERLKARRVDVLWLGANPNVPQSLKYILDPAAGSGDFASFERQRQSGLFASARWDVEGHATPDFSPIERPRGGWRIYREVLARVEASGGLAMNAIAMANLIPWGSSTAPELLAGLSAIDPSLLERVLHFADDLNAEIMRTLRPRLTLVPVSVGRGWPPAARTRVRLAFDAGKDIRRHDVEIAGRQFNYYDGVQQQSGGFMTLVVYLPHPASLYVSKPDRTKLVGVLSDFIAGLLAGRHE